MPVIDYELRGDRATVTITNPELRNALTLDTAQELTDAFEAIEESDASCVVLEGSSGTFCAGGDIELMMEGLTSERETSELMEEAAYPINQTVQRVYECPLPTVAKVDGPAYGAGASLAIACDVVLASEQAEISFGFRRVGLSVDSGTSYLLPRMVGENTAKDLVYSGDVLDAAAAEELGLFNRVYPTEEFEERAGDYIENVATGPTVGLQHSKRLLQRGLDRSFDEVIDAEVDAIGSVFETDDFAEGVEAFLEGRTPEFDGR
ncbi:enoyl-CoA hydratase/isomerase family protein [Halovenus salina]|uniref:Enoyl-CoA hydratase/isomerase family protein n=1 Tax=Halovenus salina TaxID=1510225 RepID=A0ABD5W766_9EURY|nr:enoyl-CoA hydratase-related protein [Halovenus salina]